MDGTKLKMLRNAKGISLTKLGELTGISKSYLSLIERDIQRNPSLEILGKLAKTFDVDVEYLVKDMKKESAVFQNERSTVKSTLKFEIELYDNQLNPQKIKQIKELISSLIRE
ncbi:helix-turn-helix domain-containing protein [Neobacillus drentensis]|jgi:transcriptional regulator with XRE-family HTH domain|uniref:helix-turn-helix domain-containing protein n=1 Tax=Neobacillus drentensis TaxID=220684 RepID=UPI002FFEDD7A